MPSFGKDPAARSALFLAPFLLFSVSGLSGQTDSGPWTIGIRLAGMKPTVENDRWFVTPEGYHVHPASEDFTPGLNLEIGFRVSERIQASAEVLVGRAPAYLGMIDQNSAREYHGHGRFGFLGVLLHPKVGIAERRSWTLLAGPVIGYAWTQKLRMTPSFGPSVVFGGTGQLVYGGEIGFDHRIGKSPLSLTWGVMALAMDLSMTEEGQQQRMSKSFGPIGLAAGIRYSVR